MAGRGKPARADDLLGGEYAPVSLRVSWGLVSIVCGLAALTARYWAWYLPLDLPWHQRPMVSPVVTLILGLLGLAIAGAVRHRGGMARIGLFLNGTICGILALLAVAVLIWRFMR